MSQETVKALLDKINLLFNVFMKEGLDKISELEKDLLKEQINKLLKELDAIQFEKAPIVEEVKQVKEAIEVKTAPVEIPSIEATEELVPEAIEEVKEVVQTETPPIVPESAETETPIVEEVDSREFSNSKPLRNLKEVIDLNKSFIFKAELFDNSQELYNAFITELNGFQSERESVLFVEGMANQKAWDIEGKVYELLLRSVEKRFLPLLQQ